MNPLHRQSLSSSFDRKIARRRFLMASAVSPLGLATLPAAGYAQENPSPSGTLPITVAGYPYERVAAIKDGRVAIDRCRLEFETSKIGELNQHVFSGPQTRDVTEVGLVPYLLAFCNDGFRDYLPSANLCAESVPAQKHLRACRPWNRTARGPARQKGRYRWLLFLWPHLGTRHPARRVRSIAR